MKVKKFDQKGLKKTILEATMIIGTTTMMFQGLTHVVAAEEIRKTNTIATNYVNYEKALLSISYNA